MASEDPQDGELVCYCYDYHVDTRLQNSVVHCILHIIGCIMAGACHAKRDDPQNGGCGKKVDGLHSCNASSNLKW